MSARSTVKNTPRLVAIIGGSGSGKTYLAAMLEEYLPGQVLRLSLDDFYKDQAHLTPARRAKLNFDHPRAIDWAALELVLTRLAKGEAAEIPQYDFSTHTRKATGKTVQSQPIILVEGLFPLHRAAIRRLFDYRIFLSCPEKRRFTRRLERDVAERGRTPESVRQQFSLTVSPMHNKFVEPQTQWSDLIVRRTLAAQDIARLAKRLSQ